MDTNNVYIRWISHRRRVEVPEQFTAGVMRRIQTRNLPADDGFPDGWVDREGRLMRWSAAGGLILLGLFRVAFITAKLVQPHLLMP